MVKTGSSRATMQPAVSRLDTACFQRLLPRRPILMSASEPVAYDGNFISLHVYAADGQAQKPGVVRQAMSRRNHAPVISLTADVNDWCPSKVPLAILWLASAGRTCVKANWPINATTEAVGPIDESPLPRASFHPTSQPELKTLAGTLVPSRYSSRSITYMLSFS